MLSRLHIANAAAIIGLGVLGAIVFPQVSIPIPWTVIALIMMAALVSSAVSFAGAARFSSMMLSGENRRFSRYKGPKQEYRFINDGKMTWAIIPVLGWNYLKTKINSAGNPGIAILPSPLLEQESAYYPVARTWFYKLSPRSIAILSKKRSFSRLFTDLGYVPDGKTEVFMGFGSKSLHPDATHVSGAYEMGAYAASLATTELDLKRVTDDIRQWTKGQLKFWKEIRGSDSAPIIIRRERREEEGEQR
ncbi:MAG: hypothetical protein E6K18_08780 [Methanobacteriota archaeon]|nr:MAG: hypothetical protein E6K18_08780 [Euryarchaeota archaeon]